MACRKFSGATDFGIFAINADSKEINMSDAGGFDWFGGSGSLAGDSHGGDVHLLPGEKSCAPMNVPRRLPAALRSPFAAEVSPTARSRKKRDPSDQRSNWLHGGVRRNRRDRSRAGHLGRRGAGLHPARDRHRLLHRLHTQSSRSPLIVSRNHSWYFCGAGLYVRVFLSPDSGEMIPPESFLVSLLRSRILFPHI